MLRQSYVCLCLFSLFSVAVAEDRKNYSIDDVIAGFQKNDLYYFEVLSKDGKYLKSSNKCLNSKPADFMWMKKHCKKNSEFIHAFECSEDNKFTYVWFIYETKNKCEEVREPMKDKMDAMLQ
jgi:hypothetical protein